jgi:hypothetical protein
MKLTLKSGRLVTIDFHHTMIPWPHTVALIDGKEKGRADCGMLTHKDNFSRITGRKIALARALQNVGFKKEERTEIWEALRDRGMHLFPKKNISKVKEEDDATQTPKNI